jgi:hypothetical protein
VGVSVDAGLDEKFREKSERLVEKCGGRLTVARHHQQQSCPVDRY